MRRPGEAGATLVLQTAEDRRGHVVCHRDPEGTPRLAISDGDADEDVAIHVDGESEDWPGHLFVERDLAAAVAARFLRGGERDESVEWAPRDACIHQRGSPDTGGRGEDSTRSRQRGRDGGLSRPSRSRPLPG